MERIVIVSNRVPVPSPRGERAGGLAAVLQDAVKPGTLWFGWSGNRSDSTPGDVRVIRHHGVDYATVDLPENVYRRFYVGFANGTLWPLLHFRLNLVRFRRDELEGYREASMLFARELAKLVRSGDVIWVHDYHLIPLAQALRNLGLRNRIGFYLHVPFVPASVFAVLPKGAELLADFCAYDVVGFQTEGHRGDFLDCVRHYFGYPVDTSARIAGPSRRIDCIVDPVGIDGAQFAKRAQTTARGPNGRRLLESLAGRSLMIGADRLDYSKGLPDRFGAFDRLLTRFPEYREKVSFLQIAAPSREDVNDYAALRPVLSRIAGDINARHGAFDWVPLRYVSQPLARSTLAGFFRLAKVGVVTPLCDGMNLVAHEYLFAQNPDDPGVLVLSCFAGAASYFREALIVNPYDPDEISEAMHEALAMGVVERRRRHAGLMDRLEALTASGYSARFLEALSERQPSLSAA